MAAEVDSLAGRIDAYNGRNITGMKADFLSEKMHDGLRLFLEAFLRPRWDVVEIQKEKFNILEAIRHGSCAFEHYLPSIFKGALSPASLWYAFTRDDEDNSKIQPRASQEPLAAFTQP